VGRELDLLVPPFCGAIMARDQAGAASLVLALDTSCGSTATRQQEAPTPSGEPARLDRVSNPGKPSSPLPGDNRALERKGDFRAYVATRRPATLGFNRLPLACASVLSSAAT
jgi:hypothetical protein